jgi:hypothetical protein
MPVSAWMHESGPPATGGRGRRNCASQFPPDSNVGSSASRQATDSGALLTPDTGFGSPKTTDKSWQFRLLEKS